MTDDQWKQLNRIIAGDPIDPLPVGFIIDSPWLPNWFGIDILDYYTHDDHWFNANLKAIQDFPDIMFLPGFWSEYGMCSEPSAFGARCSFPQNEFPHAYKCIESVGQIENLIKPNPEKDGLGPFILNRLKINRRKIEDAGHKIRFSISRGPLNIGSYLMGTTEFLMAMMSDPGATHSLIRTITDFLIEWHQVQKDLFPDIDGILILDDIIGFISESQFVEFGLPYNKSNIILSCGGGMPPGVTTENLNAFLKASIF